MSGTGGGENITIFVVVGVRWLSSWIYVSRSLRLRNGDRCESVIFFGGSLDTAGWRFPWSADEVFRQEQSKVVWSMCIHTTSEDQHKKRVAFSKRHP